MRIADWLENARADARRRGLDGLAPLLDNVATSMAVLRSMDWEGRVPAAPVTDAVASTGDARPLALPPRPSIAATAARLARGEVTSERLTEECLARIESLNPQLNAFVTVTSAEALATARTADKEREARQVRGPLHGIPIALKDIVDQAGVPTTASSNVRRDHVAAADAPVTARLRQAGAVFIGKTNLHEFALGTTTEESAFGPTRNPLDPSRSPGGSSGGSAVAVAAGMAYGALGTDTGGSIRIPAAACGLVGLKPQWGEIPADGVVPLSRQLDHVGPIAGSVIDAWIMYEVMMGRAAHSIDAVETRSRAKLRIGVPRGYLFDRLDADVEASVGATIELLRRQGVAIVDTSMPLIAETPHVYLLLALPDAAEYHARTLESQPGQYTEPVRLRLEMGRYVLAEDYVRAHLGKAALTLAVDTALADVDVLALPALAIPAPPIGAATVDVRGGPEAVRAAMLRCTQPFNLTGHPAVSIPCGQTASGLPIGLQLVGHRDRTLALMAAALGVERVIAGRP
jgi:aspartyl-tRNA(Asn)/glutamyl-tRNA(Gln) amidotransferase subunit A